MEETVHFGTNTIVNEIKSQGQCTKDVQLFSLVVQLFNGCTAFQKYIYEDHRICTAFSFWYKHHCSRMKLRGKDSVPKCTAFFFGCTAF